MTTTPLRALCAVNALLTLGLVSCIRPRPVVMNGLYPAASGVRGRIFTSTKQPVIGAVVAAVPLAMPEIKASRVARTQAGGSFELLLDPGQYALTATAPGHEGAFHSYLKIEKGRTAAVDIELGSTGVTVYGTVRDFCGRPVMGAKVGLSRYSNEQGDMWCTLTDERGHYEARLPKARYFVAVLADGYSEPHGRTTQGLGERVDVDLEPIDAACFAGPDVVRQLRDASATLQTVDPASPSLADLEPLAKAIGDARIVGLGEVAHGSHEVFQLKARLFRFLVERMGFTMLGIEASWSDTLPINEYLATGKGDPARLVSGMRFWIWDTEEIVDLVKWMRAYNADVRNPHKLQFAGIDMQYAPTSVAAVLAYLGPLDESYVSHLRSALAPLADEFDAERFGHLPEAVRQSVTAEATALTRYFDEHKTRLIKHGGETAWALARHHAETLLQYVELYNNTVSREQSMAANVDWLLDHAPRSTKLALWMHQAHLTKTAPPQSDGVTGALLRQHYGEAYRVFATSFGSGSFRAVGVRPLRSILAFSLPPPPAGSVEGTLARLGSALVAVDLNALPPASSAARWARLPLRLRLIGAIYAEAMGQLFDTARLADLYDVVFYIDKSSASHYLGDNTSPMAPLPKPRNLDFEDGQPNELPGWLVPRAAENAGYRGALEFNDATSGKHSARLWRSEAVRMPGYGTLEQVVDATAFAGKRVRMVAQVRLEQKGSGAGARLFLSAENSDNTAVAYGSMFDNPVRDTRWSPAAVTLEVPAGAAFLRFGLALSGDATAWIDGVSVDVVEPQGK